MKRIDNFVVNKQGNLLPAEILTTIFPSLNEGLRAWGMFRITQPKNEYIIISSKGVIDAATERISSMAKLNLNSNGSHSIT